MGRLVWSRAESIIAEQPTLAPHLARPEGLAALCVVLVAVPRVGRSCKHFPDGLDLHLLHQEPIDSLGFGVRGLLVAERTVDVEESLI